MLEEKEQYTFEELCEGLEISMSAFSKRANVDEGTIARLRRGHFGRIGTINRLLRVFSEIYGIKFTTENVTGLKKVEKPITPINKQVLAPPISTPTIDAIAQPASPQNHPTIAKRAYVKQNREKKSDLPEGCILATDFAKRHGLPPNTFRDHMLQGLGPGLIGMSTDTIPERDRVKFEEREKPGRPKEKERYLTSEQQAAAIQFWKRHDVGYSECDQEGCPCHSAFSSDK
jgi:transcriptional regulator with XRE-family HTH domain